MADSHHYKMKATLALLLSLVAISQAATKPEFLKKVSEHIELCSKENNVDKVEVTKHLTERILPQKQEVKCTITCYLEKAGYLKEGKLDWETAKETNQHKYDDEESVKKANEVADICSKSVSIEGLEKCDISNAVLKCLFEESEKLQLAHPDFLGKLTSA